MVFETYESSTGCNCIHIQNSTPIYKISSMYIYGQNPKIVCNRKNKKVIPRYKICIYDVDNDYIIYEIICIYQIDFDILINIENKYYDNQK